MRSDRVPEELWTEACDTVQEAVTKTIPKKKKCKKAKWLSEKALKILAGYSPRSHKESDTIDHACTILPSEFQ